MVVVESYVLGIEKREKGGLYGWECHGLQGGLKDNWREATVEPTTHDEPSCKGAGPSCTDQNLAFCS